MDDSKSNQEFWPCCCSDDAVDNDPYNLNGLLERKAVKIRKYRRFIQDYIERSEQND